MNSYLKILSFVEEGKKRMIAAISILIIGAICGIIPFLLFTIAGEKIIFGEAIEFQFIIKIAIGIGAFLILKATLLFKGLDITHEVAYETLMKIRIKIAEKLLVLSLGDIDKEGKGSIKKMFSEGVEDMELILAHSIPEGLSNIIAILLVIITMSIIDFRLALLIILNSIIAFASVGFMMHKGLKKMGPYYASAKNMNETLVDYDNGMEVVKVFNQTSTSFKKYYDSVNNYKDYTIDWTIDSLKSMSFYSVLFTSPLLLVLPFGTLFYLNGSLTLSNLLLSVLLSMSIGVPLTRLVQFIPSLPILGEKSKNILNFLEKTELKDENKFSSIENFDVEFSNVSFKYNEENSNYAVKNINFLAKENSITALVGESGSGKSTLTKLLIRFWDINEGIIKIGKTNIQDLSIDNLMDHISYVSQNNFLFNMSIKENLLIGKPDATEDEIIKAITSANAKEFIDTLPAGLDTITGLSGTKLSGGEMQRISIARAILKDTPIIILDEATTFTDPENEEKIQEGINKLIAKKTVFVIAHRLSTIVDADNIIVLKNGEISAQGTHEKLLDESNEYKKLWQVSKESKEWEIGGKSND